MRTIAEDARAANLTSPGRLLSSFVGLSPFWVVVLYRVGHRLQRDGVRIVPNVMRAVGLFVWGADIWPAANIGERFVIAHSHGVVVGDAVQAGSDLMLFSGVVLGGSAYHRDGSNQPTIGDNVRIFSHAVIAGGIRIGDNVVISAGAVVLNDVTDGAKVAGNPAVEVGRVD